MSGKLSVSLPRRAPPAPQSLRRPAAAVPVWLLSAALIGAFGLWFSWAPLVVALQQPQLAGQALFPALLPATAFSQSALFSLLVIAGLAAACLRLTLGFLLRPDSEALLLSACLAVLLVTAWWMYQVLGSPAFSLRQLQGLALLSGVGGGCFSALSHRPGAGSEHRHRVEFASSLGHLGIVVTLVVVPLIITLPLPGQEPRLAAAGSSHFLGRTAVGQPLWLGWAGLFWGLVLAPAFALSLRFVRCSWRALFDLLAALLLGLLPALLGAWLLLPGEAGGSGLALSVELVLAVMLFGALAAIRLWPGSPQVETLFRIFNNKHTWAMTLLWVMSLGSFLGFCAALPLTLAELFAAPGAGEAAQTPGLFLYLWMLPLAAVLLRRVSAWGAQRWGGARVTQVCIGLLFAGSLLAAYRVYGMQQAEYSPPYFYGLLMAFAVLVVAANMAHAALLSSLAKLFPTPQWRGVGIWLASVSALGVAYIPLLFAGHLQRGTPAQALLGFALFYGLCFVLNGWLYLRRHAAIYNP